MFRFWKNRRGLAAIEFALVASLFLSLFLGMAAFGFAFGTRIALAQAAAEGGRAALSGLNDAERISKATAAAISSLTAYAPLVDPARASISVTTSGVMATGETIIVRIRYSDTRFDAFPFVPSLSDVPDVTAVFVASDPS